jgi:hypothetical protein
MVHDFSLVFDTENPLWNNVLEIFERNESYAKKRVRGRALHHKYPRAFSRMLNESEDNDEDNLISLSYQDHFMIHYYYYRLAINGGCKQRMALAFKYMVEADGMPKEAITEDNLDIFKEAYNSAVIKACEYYSTFNKGKTISDEQKRIISETMRNRVWSEETKRKMSEAHKGIKQTPETIEKRRQKLLGHKTSPETIEKIRQSNLGQKRSEETKAKLREARKTYVCSEETKKKISKSNTGKVMSEEAKEKISKARTGMKFSEEHCKNIGLSKKGFKHSEETKQKLSKMMKGRKEPFTPEHLANVRAAAEKRKGTKLSEETKEKMRQNRRGKKFIIINGKRVREDKIINNVEENNE